MASISMRWKVTKRGFLPFFSLRRFFVHWLNHGANMQKLQLQNRLIISWIWVTQRQRQSQRADRCIEAKERKTANQSINYWSKYSGGKRKRLISTTEKGKKKKEEKKEQKENWGRKHRLVFRGDKKSKF